MPVKSFLIIMKGMAYFVQGVLENGYILTPITLYYAVKLPRKNWNSADFASSLSQN
ncbi:Uncharacterised protein [Legionella londiniensis]|nr:Uncharacterised protein [Legionella londiniensis]